ncbi:MAG: site-2 protease family protein [Planctomycetota bacterium]
MNGIEKVFFFVIFLFSVIIHEVAHGVMAYRLGDDTAYLKGRITLDPIRHIDLFWTILLPLFFYFGSGGRFIFGGAKPVPVNPYRFRRMRRDMMWVAIAGPGSNILLAVIFALAFRLHIFFNNPNLLEGLTFTLAAVLANGVFINLILACFNLIPIPPLDGGRILTGLLPRELAYKADKIEPYGIYILIALIFLGVTQYAFLAADFIRRALMGIGS